MDSTVSRLKLLSKLEAASIDMTTVKEVCTTHTYARLTSNLGFGVSISIT